MTLLKCIRQFIMFWKERDAKTRISQDYNAWDDLLLPNPRLFELETDSSGITNGLNGREKGFLLVWFKSNWFVLSNFQGITSDSFLIPNCCRIFFCHCSQRKKGWGQIASLKHMVRFGWNLEQLFGHTPWTHLPSFPQIPLLEKSTPKS